MGSPKLDSATSSSVQDLLAYASTSRCSMRAGSSDESVPVTLVPMSSSSNNFSAVRRPVYSISCHLGIVGSPNCQPHQVDQCGGPDRQCAQAVPCPTRTVSAFAMEPAWMTSCAGLRNGHE